MNNLVVEKYSETFKALSHPVRCGILVLLNQHECSVKEICEELHRRQSNISQHLQILRESGLLTFKNKGRRRIYKLNQNQQKIVEHLLEVKL